MNLEHLDIGDRVRYRPHGGGDRSVVIDDFGEEKGRRVFDGTVTCGPMQGESVWGYFDQITQVLDGGAAC